MRRLFRGRTRNSDDRGSRGSRPPAWLLLISIALCSVALAAIVLGNAVRAARADQEEDEEASAVQLVVDAPGTVAEATPVMAEKTAVVDFEQLAREEALVKHEGPIRTWMPREPEEPREPYFPPAPELQAPRGPARLMVPSPTPSTSFMGLDDIAMVDSMYIVIPPDVGGAVGPTRVMCGFNNDYRIFDKTTGSVIATLGTATFWAPVVAAGERLSLTDPRTLYDPYNNRWIVCMQTYTSGAGKILVGVSQTSDPGGSWYLYSWNSGYTLDFPNLGFNKNWISVAINRYSTLGTFQRGINLVVDYPSARTGTGTGTILTLGSSTHFCSAPCVTYSPTEETLYVLTHLNSSAATYELDTITGTPSSPSYTNGGSLTRTGGGWASPSGNQLPQSAPNSGSSACGSTPCKMESQDPQIRSAPVFRDGSIYYAQTIGLPSSSMTHTAAQWTRITAPGGAFSQGGRIEDPTATSTNGGEWYAYTHIAVNAAGDFIVGYTQFSSAHHPSAGYSMHLASDGAGVLRDPYIYHAGEDYYHKTFSTATGRNRWGDFSTCQVDPDDDATLWTLQEYAKTRTGTNDGNTGSNSSRWSTWWAAVTTATTYTIQASAGPHGTIDPSGNVSVPEGGDQSFSITPDACYHVDDVLVDGGSVGSVTSYPFTNVQANHTIAASFAIDTYTITASAGSGGTIAPTGDVSVDCGSDQGFTISADPGMHIADVLVDGGSVGPVSAHTFHDVHEDHTIAASFAADHYMLTTSVIGGGHITLLPSQPFYAYGDTVSATAVADLGWSFDHWNGDASGSANPTSVIMTSNKAIEAVFVDIAAPSGVAVVTPNGGEVWSVASSQTIEWTASDNDDVAAVDLFLSLDGGVTFPDTIAIGLANSGSYGWTVPNLPTTTARVQVVARDAAGNAASDSSDADFEIRSDLTDVPASLLSGKDGLRVYPNPAAPGTMRILYALKKPASVELSVFDAGGRLVRRLASGAYAGGAREIVWDGRDGEGKEVPAGVYFVRLVSSGGLRTSERMTILR